MRDNEREIYYFRIGREDGSDPGTGLFRLYTVDSSHDETLSIADQDTYLVRGHGPTVADPSTRCIS